MIVLTFICLIHGLKLMLIINYIKQILYQLEIDPMPVIYRLWMDLMCYFKARCTMSPLENLLTRLFVSQFL